VASAWLGIYPLPRKRSNIGIEIVWIITHNTPINFTQARLNFRSNITGGVAITTNFRFSLWNYSKDKTFNLRCNLRAFACIGNILVCKGGRIRKCNKHIWPSWMSSVDSGKCWIAESSPWDQGIWVSSINFLLNQHKVSNILFPFKCIHHICDVVHVLFKILAIGFGGIVGSFDESVNLSLSSAYWSIVDEL